MMVCDIKKNIVVSLWKSPNRPGSYQASWSQYWTSYIPIPISCPPSWVYTHKGPCPCIPMCSPLRTALCLWKSLNNKFPPQNTFLWWNFCAWCPFTGNISNLPPSAFCLSFCASWMPSAPRALYFQTPLNFHSEFCPYQGHCQWGSSHEYLY